MEAYKEAYSYKLIYIMSIPDEDHEGFLKIGDASLASRLGVSQLPPNCDDLNAAAHARIKEYTKTGLIKYRLYYTELAIRYIQMDNGDSMPQTFRDTAIHDVLARSGYLCKRFPDTDRDSEWYQVDLDTAINAVKAYKEGRNELAPAEKTKTAGKRTTVVAPRIVLRQEQLDAVERTLDVFRVSDRMLWDCKMRFGKTVTSYELIKRAGFLKTIVVTHRPVVEAGWAKDHDLIFDEKSNHLFVTKKMNGSTYEYDAAIDSENDRVLRNYASANRSFVYFASMQDLRGSKIAGGKWDKNSAVFQMDWDLIIYDEAHEGTQTELGKTVQELLEKPKNGKSPKVLSLSGTPYNLMNQYEDTESVYSWDYVTEQRRKKEFAENYPDLSNPYEDLPELRILTFDLKKTLANSYRYETEDMAFNFREFFRTWTGDPEEDFGPIPKGAKVGDFVHEEDITNFLNLITQEDEDSQYPFSNEHYRDMFRHTFWMVPGVKAARALSSLLKVHPIFRYYAIANVAGDGDYEEAYEDALIKVQTAIKNNPYTITISCGRLTTGVTVPEWSAVMMLAGSSNTSASGYMQTIFRVQSAGSVNGKQKQVAYVFDFAPDRALNVIAEVHKISRKGKTDDEDAKESLGEFLNFCPIISTGGTQMVEYNVPKMMRQLKKMNIDRVIKSGFEDDSLYKDEVGIVMNDMDVKLFNELAEKIHGKQKSKLPKKVTINQQGFTDEEYRKANKAKRKKKIERTLEEEALLKREREIKKEREKVIALLRAVSIRLPMLIFGANVNITEDIRMTDFPKLVDDESWDEFMPQQVSKDLFSRLLKYYDEDVVVEAGLKIRRLSKAADELPPTRRVQRIAEIFSLFRNPDKETVLTPWRVVNMHMGDTLGGYNFYEEGYPLDGVLEEPRLIDNGDVTADILLNDNAQILEMNSKSGLYPLYLCYSLYAIRLPKKESQVPIEEAQRLWQETLEQNIYVLCKTKMAVGITKRTLAGYHDDWDVRAIHLSRLLDRMQDMHRLRNKLTNPTTWRKEGDRLKFDAIVGNPPYQEMDGGGKGYSAKPIYNLFVEQAKLLNPHYISMITPSRWFTGGKGLDDFRDGMLHDTHLKKIFDYADNRVLFDNVSIVGGVNYFLWALDFSGQCEVTSIRGKRRTTLIRDLNEYDIFIRNNDSVRLIRRIQASSDQKMDSVVLARNVFGISSDFRGVSEKDGQHSIALFSSHNSNSMTITYVNQSEIGKNEELISKYKVIMGKVVPRGGEVGVDPSIGYRVTSTLQVLSPESVFTDSYLLLGSFEAKQEAINFAEYMTLKMPRFLLHETYSSMNISKQNFRFVPYLDYSRKWSDEDLFKKYDCTEEEIDMIKAMIRPMEYVFHEN